MKFARLPKDTPALWLSWLSLGVILLLLGLLAVLALRDLGRGSDVEQQTLREKGSVLIRALESGTRAGMGMRMHHAQLQTLLEEMAWQPGVLYFAVINEQGTIIAHSDPDRSGKTLYDAQEIRGLNVDDEASWRRTVFTDASGEAIPALEIYRHFKPQLPAMGMGHRGHGAMARQGRSEPALLGQALEIFVALDARALDAAQEKERRNALGVFLALGAVLLAAVLAMFWVRRYQRSQALLQDARTVSAEIINNLPVGLIFTDKGNTISVVNPTAAQLLKLNRDTVIGQPAEQCLPASWLGPMVNCRTGGTVLDDPQRLAREEGEALFLSVSMASIVNQQRQFLGTVIIVSDKTELYQLHETIRRKEKLAALGQLAAGVAHEIRNPLSSIKGLAKYFAERAPMEGENWQLAQVMAKEADRLNRVVSELLELVRPTRLALQEIDLNQVVEHSLQLVRQDALTREISLQFTVNPALCRVSADPDRLTQVLLNLYLNAIHAIGQQGSIVVAIARHGDSMLRITVRDSGHGIPSGQLAEIFTPYFTTRADGTGLGLAVVQNIIEQHGGKISVESEPDRGTCFTLELPLQPSLKDNCDDDL